MARADGSLRQLLRRLNRIDVLVVDDWVMAPMSEAQRRDFWEIAEDRYQTRSMILTSQLPVSRWHEQIGDPHWPTESSTGWCTTRIASRCVGTPCVKRKERRRKSECIGGPKAVEKTGERRPWKSQERFPLSHSFNNNKLDDRDHFQQNAKTSVASLRGLIGSSRNTDRHHSGMLIDFIGIPKS